MFPIRILASCLLVATLFLSGCEERSANLFLYGPAKPCYAKTLFSSVKTCNKLTVYDRLTLHVNRDRQEVVYLQQGLGLDESNSLFKKLENCTVVDKDNFSCAGLARIEGQFLLTEVFGDRAISSSHLGYAYSYRLNSSIKKNVLEILDDYNSWVAFIAIMLALFFMLALVS